MAIGYDVTSDVQRFKRLLHKSKWCCLYIYCYIGTVYVYVLVGINSMSFRQTQMLKDLIYCCMYQFSVRKIKLPARSQGTGKLNNIHELAMAVIVIGIKLILYDSMEVNKLFIYYQWLLKSVRRKTTTTYKKLKCLK